MATGKWLEVATWATKLSTELNALANSSYSNQGTAVDNSTDLALFIQARVNLAAFSVAPTAGSTIALYLMPGDGSHWSEGSSTVVPSPSHRVWSWRPDASTAARWLFTPFLELRATSVKPLMFNGSGQAFGATGSTVELRTLTYSIA